MHDLRTIFDLISRQHDKRSNGGRIALQDATLENGALWVVRNSHAPGVIYDRKAHELPSVDSMTQAVGFEDIHDQAMPLPMKRGDVLCFNGYLLHSSLPNYSDACRPALTMHFCSMCVSASTI